jgi:hypothetical protein
MIALPAAIRALYRSTSRSNTAWGRALLGSLLLSRIVAFASGCGPKDGDEGGRCLSSGSCYRDGHCNDPSLVCNGANVCVKASMGGPSANDSVQPVPPPPPSPCDVLLGQTSCPAGRSKSCVDWWATPDPAWSGACVAQARDGQAATVFCCDESRPMCRYVEGTLVAWPANLNWANCPGASYLCHDLTAPPIPDAPIPNAPIQCADDLPNDAGWAATCCVSGDACFVLEGHLSGSKTDGYYPRGACAPGEEEHFCTGNATLGDGPCRAVPTPEGGVPPTQPRVFCCPHGYVPADSDAGANARSDAGETDGAPDGASD